MKREEENALYSLSPFYSFLNTKKKDETAKHASLPKERKKFVIHKTAFAKETLYLKLNLLYKNVYTTRLLCEERERIVLNEMSVSVT